MTAGIELFSIGFWFLTISGVFAVTVLRQPRHRLVMVVCVHLLVLYWAVGGTGTALLLGALVTAYVALRVGSPTIALIAPALAVFIGFKLGTLPAIRSVSGQELLAITGYSYVFLRWVDLVRTIRAGVAACPSPLDFIHYMIPFHMLSAGPIQTYRDYVDHPISCPPLTFHKGLSSTERIAKGLFKKFVLAHIIQSVCLTGFQAGPWYTVLELQLFFIWLYLDFSAYCDVAVGIGMLLGLHVPENFNRPYLARNVIDFWERWHITLGQSVRAHLFVPVQLALMRTRLGRYRLGCASVAFGVAFLLCGLWHQFTMPFFLWGAIHAGGVVICNAYKTILIRRYGKKWFKRYNAHPVVRVVATVITFEFVACSLYWVGKAP